jgi:hypothetical protein
MGFLRTLTLTLVTLAAAGSAVPAAQREHSDHRPRHGGLFFMAPDGVHHVEGALERPATLRVYLYDGRTRPLPAARVRAARATVYWGMSTKTAGQELRPAADGSALEVALDRTPTFPVTLTLLLTWPGAPPGKRPDLYTFIFEGISTPAQTTSHHH